MARRAPLPVQLAAVTQRAFVPNEADAYYVKGGVESQKF
jgi:hypothetical protein